MAKKQLTPLQKFTKLNLFPPVTYSTIFVLALVLTSFLTGDWHWFGDPPEEELPVVELVDCRDDTLPAGPNTYFDEYVELGDWFECIVPEAAPLGDYVATSSNELFCSPHRGNGMTLDLHIVAAVGDPVTVNITADNFEFVDVDNSVTGEITLNPGSILRISPLTNFHNLDNIPW